jgi:hypothetical protein
MKEANTQAEVCATVIELKCDNNCSLSYRLNSSFLANVCMYNNIIEIHTDIK